MIRYKAILIHGKLKLQFGRRQTSMSKAALREWRGIRYGVGLRCAPALGK